MPLEVKKKPMQLTSTNILLYLHEQDKYIWLWTNGCKFIWIILSLLNITQVFMMIKKEPSNICRVLNSTSKENIKHPSLFYEWEQTLHNATYQQNIENNAIKTLEKKKFDCYPGINYWPKHINDDIQRPYKKYMLLHDSKIIHQDNYPKKLSYMFKFFSLFMFML